MRKILLYVFFVSIITTSLIVYNRYFAYRNIEITDITKEQVLILKENYSSSSIYGISITIVGNIDGSAIIQRSYQGEKVYEEKMISGNVNLHMGGDWYDKQCLITYKPTNVKNGNLNIIYKFKTF